MVSFMDEIMEFASHIGKYEGVNVDSLTRLVKTPYESNESTTYCRGYDGDILMVSDSDNEFGPWVSVWFNDQWVEIANINNGIIEVLEFI